MYPIPAGAAPPSAEYITSFLLHIRRRIYRRAADMAIDLAPGATTPALTAPRATIAPPAVGMNSGTSASAVADGTAPGHAPGDNIHSRPASHALTHDHAHPDGSPHDHSEERVTFSPIAAPHGTATPASGTGPVPSIVACGQDATHTAGAPPPARSPSRKRRRNNRSHSHVGRAARRTAIHSTRWPSRPLSIYRAPRRTVRHHGQSGTITATFSRHRR